MKIIVRFFIGILFSLSICSANSFDFEKVGHFGFNTYDVAVDGKDGCQWEHCGVVTSTGLEIFT